MYGYGYSRCSLSVACSPGVIADDVTTPSTGDMTALQYGLKNDAEVLSLDIHHRLQAMRQLYLEGDVRWLQQHVLLSAIVEEDIVTISEAKWMKLRKLVNEVTGIVRRDSTSMNLMKRS